MARLLGKLRDGYLAQCGDGSPVVKVLREISSLIVELQYASSDSPFWGVLASSKDSLGPLVENQVTLKIERAFAQCHSVLESMEKVRDEVAELLNSGQHPTIAETIFTLLEMLNQDLVRKKHIVLELSDRSSSPVAPSLETQTDDIDFGLLWILSGPDEVTNLQIEEPTS